MRSFKSFHVSVYKIIILLMPLVISACGGGGGAGAGAGSNPVAAPEVTTIVASGLVASSAVVIDPAKTTSLTQISSDKSIITFTGTDATKESIDVGDTLAMGITSSAPDGLLRKVTAISVVGNQTIFTTTQGTLADVLESAHIAVTGVVDPDDIETSQSNLKGVYVSKVSAPINNKSETLDATNTKVLAVDQTAYKFQTVLKDVVLYDDDNDPNTTYDQIIANGKLLFNLNYRFEMDVKNFQIQSLLFTATPKEYSDLNISTNIQIPALSKKKTLKTLKMKPFIVQVGVLPIVVRPIIDLNVGIDGTLEVGISTGVSQSASITGGLNYADNAWNVISTQNSQFEYEPPQITANAAVLAYAGPTLTLQLYGIVGPNTNAEGYLSFDADIVNTPFWTLYGGVRMGVGIDVSVLGNNIASYSVPDVLSHQELLAQSAPLPPTNIVITPGITDTTISWDATLDASKYNLYWSTQAGVQIASSTKIANVTSPFIHNGRTSEQTYYYVLTAENIFEESVLSDEVSTTTLSVNGPIDFLGKTYYRVTSPYTGRVWLDRNLGADRVCLTYDDVSCYGDYYQWGRGNDGHQLLSAQLALTVDGVPAVADALVGLDSQFYSNVYKPYDWTSLDSDGTIRQEYWRTNGVCPAGFRVPASYEILAERDGYNAGSNTDLFDMFLKLPSAGYREGPPSAPYVMSGVVNPVNSIYLWTNSTVLLSSATYPYMRAYALKGIASNTALESRAMDMSHSVRCIMQ